MSSTTTSAFLSSFTPNFSLSHSSVLTSHSFESNCPVHRRVSGARHWARVQISAAHPDVVIIGGGTSGLSTAFELARTGASVRILTSPTRRSAGLAAAGMLAPNCENLPPDMYALCKASLQMYPSFLSTLRNYAPNHPVPLRAFDDFLIPSLDGQPPAPVSPTASSRLLSAELARHIEPALGPRVSAARAVSSDASVDNRRLLAALRAACLSLSVHIDECVVHRLIPTGDRSYSVETDNGVVHASHILVAAGAWTHSLLPNIPVRSFKGQMLSLALPYGARETQPALQHVLYSDDIYIVPREEDRPCYYVGATVEPDEFSTNTTAAGILTLLQNAIALVPSFENYEIVESWAGFRPGTPDLAPVFGMTTLPNVSVASGFYRNGILLAPITAKIASAVARNEPASLSQELGQFLHAFSATRFFENSSSVSSSENIQAFTQATQPAEVASPNRKDISATNHSVTSAGVDRPKPSLFKIHKDGTKEPIYPPVGWEPEFKHQTKELAKSSTGKENSNGQDGSDPVNNMHEVWSEEENQNSEASSVTGSLDEFMNQVNSIGSTPASSETLPEDANGDVENKDNTEEGSENGKGLNDAYDDILLKKNAEADFHGRKARAANRAFGRKKSRLETDGSPVLSLNDEEVVAFDAAFASGLQDMENFGRCFDESDPSKLATKKDMSLIESVASSSNNTSPSSTDSNPEGSTENVNVDHFDPEGLSLDGYF